eukprot:1144115-Pelagomonas_calceolata.AAC.3
MITSRAHAAAELVHQEAVKGGGRLWLTLHVGHVPLVRYEVCLHANIHSATYKQEFAGQRDWYCVEGFLSILCCFSCCIAEQQSTLRKTCLDWQDSACRTYSTRRPFAILAWQRRRLWSSGELCAAVSAFGMALSGLGVKLLQGRVPTFEQLDGRRTECSQHKTQAGRQAGRQAKYARETRSGLLQERSENSTKARAKLSQRRSARSPKKGKRIPGGADFVDQLADGRHSLDRPGGPCTSSPSVLQACPHQASPCSRSIWGSGEGNLLEGFFGGTSWMSGVEAVHLVVFGCFFGQMKSSWALPFTRREELT